MTKLAACCFLALATANAVLEWAVQPEPIGISERDNR